MSNLKFASLFGAGLVIALGPTAEANAQRGLTPDQIRYYCSMGSQTPVSVRPYCGGGGYRGPRHAPGPYGGPPPYGGGYYRESRPLSPSELQYYCSMGAQTPVSARADCVRHGYWR